MLLRLPIKWPDGHKPQPAGLLALGPELGLCSPPSDLLYSICWWWPCAGARTIVSGSGSGSAPSSDSSSVALRRQPHSSPLAVAVEWALDCNQPTASLSLSLPLLRSHLTAQREIETAELKQLPNMYADALASSQPPPPPFLSMGVMDHEAYAAVVSNYYSTSALLPLS